MKMRIRSAQPYRTKDGSWDVKDTWRDIDIPDENLNRHSILCAACGFKGYPECTSFCSHGKKTLREAET